MTEPVRVGELLPGVLGRGRGPGRATAMTGGPSSSPRPATATTRSASPAGSSTPTARPARSDRSTTASREPDGVLLKACGTRRESRCPSCAATYRADAYQLLAAGLKGGKGVPETVAAHPRLFVTFTAPSFGRVHSRKAQGRLVLPCHPYRQGARCPHGGRAGCWHRHDEDDPRLGEPLCPSCYDAQAPGAVERPGRPSCGGGPPSPSIVPWPGWSAWTRRSCGGWSGSRTPRWPSSSDGGRSTSTPSSAWTRPPTAAALAAWPHHPSRSPPPSSRRRSGRPSRPSACPARPWMAGRTGMPAGGSSSTSATSPRAATRRGSCRPSRWPATSPSTPPRPPRASAAASTDASTPTTWTTWTSCRRMWPSSSGPAWELGGRPELEGLRLRAWAHMLGLRRPLVDQEPPLLHHLHRPASGPGRLRQAPPGQGRRAPGCLGPARGRPGRDRRRLLGLRRLGLCDRGGAWLALSAAARAREQRRIAREELTTTTDAA